MSRPDFITWALDMADGVRTRSKDPRTTVGALIARPDGTIASTGYNGFPRKVNDAPELYEDRNKKLLRTIHAELNAILFAKESLEGCTIYVSPRLPCAQCSAAIIQSGIKKVVVRYTSKSTNWTESIEEGLQMFKEADVEVVILDQ